MEKYLPTNGVPNKNHQYNNTTIGNSFTVTNKKQKDCKQMKIAKISTLSPAFFEFLISSSLMKTSSIWSTLNGSQQNNG